jgi:hypothetical protein
LDRVDVATETNAAANGDAHIVETCLERETERGEGHVCIWSDNNKSVVVEVVVIVVVVAAADCALLLAAAKQQRVVAWHTTR